MIRNTLKETFFHFPNQTAFYRGKVRDVYIIDNRWIVLIATDRISAFDVILPKPIPFKGQVLNQIAGLMLTETSAVVPNWFIVSPDPVVSIGKWCIPYKVEIVVRGYLAGHAAREYKSGKRILCGIRLPDGLKENDVLPEPIITPTTKSEKGHDEDISREEIIQRKLIPEEEYQKIEKWALLLFEKGSALARERGLILADTKYEFGKDSEGNICLIDEVHTPDSSRYFYLEGYEEKQKQGIPQKQLSKEFVRQWLIEKGFQGKPGQVIPDMSDEFVNEVSTRYIELFETVTGKKLEIPDMSNISDRVYKAVCNYFNFN